MFPERKLLDLLTKTARRHRARCNVAKFRRLISEANLEVEEVGFPKALFSLLAAAESEGVIREDLQHELFVGVYRMMTGPSVLPAGVADRVSLRALLERHSGDGLTAVVAAPQSGAHGSDSHPTDLSVSTDIVVECLERLGFEVVPPVDHSVGTSLCVVERAYDLLVAVAWPPSDRVGAQVRVAASIGSPVIAVSHDQTDPSCLFSTTTGLIAASIKLDGDEASLALALQCEVLRLIPQARDARTLRHEQMPYVRDLMQRLLDGEYTPEGNSVAPTVAEINEARVDPHAARMLSLVQIDAALRSMDETPLYLGDVTNLLTKQQRAAMHLAGPMSRHERLRIAVLAFREMAQASALASTSRRMERWTTPEPWIELLEEVRQLQD